MNEIKELSEKDAIAAAENGAHQITILRGTAQNLVFNPFDLKELSINAVAEYLTKEDKYSPENLTERIQDSYVLYSYENLYLKLIYNNRQRVDAENKGDIIHGALVLHPDLKKWSINGDKRWTNLEMADFIKMNRHYFDNKAEAMSLVSELRNMKTKVEKEAELSDNKKGDYRYLAAQKVIESNIPESFMLVLPVFIGQEKVRVPVEVEISADNFACTLISPELKEYIDTEAKTLIDAQLEQIAKLFPLLRIYQK